MSHVTIRACRICGNTQLHSVLHLGEQALTGVFPRSPSDPVEVGPVWLRQRTWVPAMVPWRATEEGYVTEDVIAWYERFARGMPGAIVVEATGIRYVPSGPLLRIGHDRFLPGLTRLVETVR